MVSLLRSEHLPRLSRREWLKLAACGVSLGSSSGWLQTLAADAAHNPQRKRACILLWMSGGCSEPRAPLSVKSEDPTLKIPAMMATWRKYGFGSQKGSVSARPASTARPAPLIQFSLLERGPRGRCDRLVA